MVWVEKTGDKDMSNRGSAEFYTQKGFLSEFTVKQEGQVPETLPPDPGTDVTEGAEVDNADVNAPKAANISASDNKPASTSTTMDKEVGDIPEKAEGDIADGYVSDIQHLPGPGDREKKGFEQYNEMVGKGIAVDPQGLNKWNIDQAVDMIVKSANEEFDGTMSSSFGGWMSSDMSVKSLDDSLVVKMEGNAAPEDEEANEGLTEDSEAVGSTKEETDEDKGKQGENMSKPQTGGSNESFSEGGPTEEKGWKDKVGRGAKYLADKATGASKYVGGKAREGLMSYGTGGKKQSRIRFLAREAAKRTGGKKETYLGAGLIGGGALAGGGAAYGALRKKKELNDTSEIVAKNFDGTDVESKGIGTALAAHGLAGAGIGAGTSALASEKGRGWEGAKRGAKYGAIGGIVGGPVGAGIGGYWARATKYKDKLRAAKAKYKKEKAKIKAEG